MDWIIFSVLASILLASGGVIDEFFSRGIFRDNVFVYVFGGGFFLLLTALAIFAVYPQALQVPAFPAVAMAALGAVIMVGYICLYMMAIKRTGAAIVIPVFQTIPVFIFLGGYLFLNETITPVQMAACAVIMVAAIAVTWDFKTHKIDAGGLLLSIAACIGIAAYMLCARYFAQDYDAYTIMAYVWAGYGGMSLVLVAGSGTRRRVLLNVVRQSPFLAPGVMALQGVLLGLSEIFLVSALATAPAAGLVQTISGMQPVWVLIIFTVLGFALPSYYQKLVPDRHLAWKIICIIILFAGVAVISLNGHE